MVCAGCERDLPRCVLRHALAWFNTPVGSLPTLPRYCLDPTEVLSRPYRGICATLPRYCLDPTEVFVRPYRGIAWALPRYCLSPWLYDATRLEKGSVGVPTGGRSVYRLARIGVPTCACRCTDKGSVGVPICLCRCTDVPKGVVRFVRASAGAAKVPRSTVCPLSKVQCPPRPLKDIRRSTLDKGSHFHHFFLFTSVKRVDI